jgi:hypothetical protein
MRIKKEMIRLLVIATFASVLSFGCQTRRVVVASPTGEVLVAKAPPAPRTEVVTVAPSTSHVWQAGYWSYRNGRYVWVPGRYELRPRASAVWVPGHWDRTTRGWVWTPGHWE